ETHGAIRVVGCGAAVVPGPDVDRVAAFAAAGPVQSHRSAGRQRRGRTRVVIAPRAGRRLAHVVAGVGVPVHRVAGDAVGLAVVGRVRDGGERPSDRLRRVVPDTDPGSGEARRGGRERAGE